MMPAAYLTDEHAIAERRRLIRDLGLLCGLKDPDAADHCGNQWCNYFDKAQSRCGLLEWDVPARLGPEALRWFVAHKTTDTSIDDATLAMRCSGF